MDAFQFRLSNVQRAKYVFTGRHGIGAKTTLDEFIAMEEDEPMTVDGVSRSSLRLEQFANTMASVAFNMFRPLEKVRHTNNSSDGDMFTLLKIVNKSGEDEENIVKTSIDNFIDETATKHAQTKCGNNLFGSAPLPMVSSSSSTTQHHEMRQLATLSNEEVIKLTACAPMGIIKPESFASNPDTFYDHCELCTKYSRRAFGVEEALAKATVPSE